jgi:tetratricopeptide (TPR) repeat protein
LDKAFAYFNNCVNEGELRKDFEETRKNIQAGVHPISNQAFTKIGSYMARALEEEGGGEFLLSCQKRGPVAFFSEYIKLSEANSAPKKYPRFKPEFVKLMADWDKEWSKTYTDDVRHLYIGPATDFEKLGIRLKETFAGASFYPDFTSDLVSAARSFLEKNNPERATSILTLGQDLYPGSPVILASLGLANIWQGQVETARNFYLKASGLDSTHPSLSVSQFIASANMLVQAEKIGEAQALANIAIEFYPKEARLYVGMSNLSLLLGQKQKAVEYLKKALKINPNLEEAKEKLRAIER